MGIEGLWGGEPAVDRASALAELKARITQDLAAKGHRAWFWPRWNGVSGFEGTAPIIFVGLNPSTGTFPNRADKLLYHHLAMNGFADAHLTDAMKYHTPNTDVPAILADGAMTDLHQKWLAEEVQIIQPRLIVALGLTKTYDLLRRWLPVDGRVRAVPHSAWAKRWGQEARFAEAMAAIRAELDGMAR